MRMKRCPLYAVEWCGLGSKPSHDERCGMSKKTTDTCGSRFCLEQMGCRVMATHDQYSQLNTNVDLGLR